MASIQVDKGYLRIKFYQNGKADYEYFGLDTKENRTKAEYRLKELEFRLSRNDQVVKNNLLLDNAFLMFYGSKAKLSPAYKNIFEAVRKHCQLFFPVNFTVQQFNKTYYDNFEKYLSKIVGENSVITYLTHFRVLFQFLKKEGYVEKNYVPVQSPIEQTFIETIPPNHKKRILNYFEKTNIEQYTFLCFLDFSGRRQSDAIALRWTDLDFKNSDIYMRNVKGKRREFIFMFPAFKKVMLSFWKLRGKPLTGQVFQYKNKDSLKWWVRGLKKIKDMPHYKMHSFRRTFASDAVNEGIKTADTMALGGWKDERTLRLFYTRNDAKRLGKIAAKIRQGKP